MRCSSIQPLCSLYFAEQKIYVKSGNSIRNFLKDSIEWTEHAKFHGFSKMVFLKVPQTVFNAYAAKPLHTTQFRLWNVIIYNAILREKNMRWSLQQKVRENIRTDAIFESLHFKIWNELGERK